MPRPALWFLAPGGLPVPATTKRAPSGVTHQAYEHDASWTPLPGRGGVGLGWVGRSFVPRFPIVTDASWDLLEPSDTAPETSR